LSLKLSDKRVYEPEKCLIFLVEEEEEVVDEDHGVHERVPMPGFDCLICAILP